MGRLDFRYNWLKEQTSEERLKQLSDIISMKSFSDANSPQNYLLKLIAEELIILNSDKRKEF